jgi:hypothetical protein
VIVSAVIHWEATMDKFLLGVGAAAFWLLLGYAANAERVCNQVCDAGTCVSKCVEHPDADVVVHEHERNYEEPGVHVGVPGVGIDIGR